jgi:hypothetical protein
VTVTEVDRNWNPPIQAGFSACVTILKQGHRIRDNSSGVIEVAVIEDGRGARRLTELFPFSVRTGELQHHPAQTRGVTTIYVAGKLSEG